MNGECLGRGPGPGTERVIHISPIDHTQIYYCQYSSMLTHADYGAVLNKYVGFFSFRRIEVIPPGYACHVFT